MGCDGQETKRLPYRKRRRPAGTGVPALQLRMAFASEGPHLGTDSSATVGMTGGAEVWSPLGGAGVGGMGCGRQEARSCPTGNGDGRRGDFGSPSLRLRTGSLPK